MIAKDGIVATDYILAPLGDKRLLDLKVTFNLELEKTIAGVPLQQNYKTNIKGEFSNFYASVFTVSDQVEDYTNEDVDIQPKVGSFYYDDNTFSNTFYKTKTCIGIVYVVNPDGKTGKIVSLDEENNILWSTELHIDTYATDDNDGAGNTAKVLALASYIADNTKYPAFAWCADKNTSAPAGIKWYIPANDELSALYFAYNGSAETANATARTAFNTQLTTAGGTGISEFWYWSSTQNNGALAWYVDFYDNCTSYVFKNRNLSVRVVSAF